jgi:HK97 family phage major capsid protein
MALTDLREKRAKLIADARELVGAAVNRGDALTGDEKDKIAKLREDAKAIGDLIAAAEEAEADARSLQAATRAPAAPKAPASREADEAFRRFMATGEVREQSLTAAEGGYTVAPDVSFYGRVVDAMKLWGGVEMAPVTVLSTATGADLPIPTDDDTSNVGALVAETGSHASGTAITLGQTTLKAYLYSSKIVKVSWQLLQDSAINWETFLANKFAMRLGRAKNLALTTGTGSAQPQGVQYASTNGRTCASGYTTSCTADDLVRLFHSVDPVYRNPAVARWMFNDGAALIIRLLKDGDGQYLWRPGLAEGAPDRLLGYPIVINPDMPDMAAGVKSVLFGDFSAYFVRNVQGLEVRRLNELYAANGQVGVIAFMRFDGALIDAGQHPVKAMTNAAS